MEYAITLITRDPVLGKQQQQSSSFLSPRL